MSALHDSERIRTDDEDADADAPATGSASDADTANAEPYRLLDTDGNLVGASEPPLPDEDLLAMYEHMVTARHFDERAISFQRQGRLATYAPMTGQEGAQVASTMALAEDDWIFPTYREHAVRLVAGLDLTQQLLPLRGIRASYGDTGYELMPESIPIATQLPHATGAAMGMDYEGTDRVAMAHFGDGATSEGDFHEGLNVAGVFDAPVVFLCHNNQYAISTPRKRQTASATLAQKAEAYGFEGVQVDGMDPLAVYQVTREAANKARDPADGELRPTLVESVEYRLGAHTTSDDPSVYRDEAEVAEWRERDPLARLETFLAESGRLDDETTETIQERAETAVADAMAEAEQESPDPEALFRDTYEELPPQLEAQLQAMQGLEERHGDALRQD